ncbi:MAG: FKBP-type peptidyl-prolyl cis-trans isomerase 2 [Chloroflexi bacterium]|nr:MAG: FKBP-type peptidyl-prolyl cis-trans isomerase 2 [Chloroflexota bacterium]
MRISIPRLHLALIALLSLGLIAAACGGDDDAAAEQAQSGLTEPTNDDAETIDDPETEVSDDGATVSVQNPDAAEDDDPPAADDDPPAAADDDPPAADDDAPPANGDATVRNGIEIISLTGTAEGDPAADGDSVGVRYRGTLDDGTQFDANTDGELLPVTIGTGGVIAGFDEALRGLRLGETIIVRIPALLAYGASDEALIFELPRDQTPPGMMVGQNVRLGNGVTAEIIEITDELVIIDGNPPLAGEALTFEISIERFQ